MTALVGRKSAAGVATAGRRAVVRAARALLLGVVWIAGAHAAVAPPLAADPALEARVMAIAEELRCLVCQNETLAASQADLAKDLRAQIRRKLAQGENQAQILRYMTDRYGDFVLYRPPWKASTVALWVGPFALLAVGAVALWRQAGRRGALPPAGLDAAQSQRARRLLADESDAA